MNYISSISFNNRIVFDLSFFLIQLHLFQKIFFSDNSTLIFCTSILAIVSLGAFSTEATGSLTTCYGSFVEGFHRF